VHFRRHSQLEGAHAFLSPSTYHWINYTIERLRSRWATALASAAGVEQHAYAAYCIDHGLLQEGDSLLDVYINDCISFRMQSEVVLYYSDNAFGTADAIVFRYLKLRISDLKTGVSRTSVHQLEVYAAYFCLEYGVDPYDIDIELRIYQDTEDDTRIRMWDGDPGVIQNIMDKTIEFDAELNRLREVA
jgi:hypothetical protein